MRPIYRRRRDALLAALAHHLPDLEPSGAAAGLHVLAWLPAEADEARITTEAAGAGIAITGLTPMRVAPGRAGLSFGYGAIPESGSSPASRASPSIARVQAGRSSATPSVTRSPVRHPSDERPTRYPSSSHATRVAVVHVELM